MSLNLNIRSANIDDVDLIYKWSNDDLVRQQSFNSDVIPYESHCKWFEGKLKNENSLIYIIEVDNRPASLIRFDIGYENATIGVLISSNFRGKGLGNITIKYGVEEYFKSRELPIIASIKNENIASIKSFERAGFSFLKDEIINGSESVIYQIEK